MQNRKKLMRTKNSLLMSLSMFLIAVIALGSSPSANAENWCDEAERRKAEWMNKVRALARGR